MVNYEWDQADESDEDYNRRMTKARTIQKIEETKRRLHRMRAIELQRLQAEREMEVSTILNSFFSFMNLVFRRTMFLFIGIDH